jgi:transposase
MVNLSVHEAGWVKDLIEKKACQLWLLRSYSPDTNPIAEACSKVKNRIRKAKARTPQGLFAATVDTLGSVSEEDVRAFFEEGSGYGPRRGYSSWKLL